MKRSLKSVSSFSESSVFSQGQLRWWIFEASRNGMADHGVVVRVGRRVYIDIDAFERWIDSQQSQGVAA
ncbi:DNA-binding protein [Stenotrophomonas sp.]|uniref:DNA-binding protein n=1 Tax=Stenotrophomonas sp. TaxID=69392 RepID=UPI0025F95107|nr:DNA-binding protein [Stenotrophomonas sp.]MBW8373620.1 DNA-binding protein [Stenotrophomonas sp.]